MSAATLAKQAKAMLASPWAGHARRHAWLAGPRRESVAQEGRGGRVNGAGAHPEDACKAGRGGGHRRAANQAVASSGCCGGTAMPAAIHGHSGRFLGRDESERGGGARGVPGCSRKGTRRWG
jgi:hypothetical protein